MQSALDVVRPEIQESPQDREIRREVELLPDIALKQARMIRQVIENLGRREPVAFELQAKMRHGGSLRLQNSRAQSFDPAAELFKKNLTESIL